MLEQQNSDSGLKLEYKNRHFLLTSCHRIPERSFFYKGKPLLCYRCLGLNGGFFFFTTIQLLFWILSLMTDLKIALIYFIEYFSEDKIILKFLIILATQVPFIVDGTIQAIFDWYESNNITRFITGLLGGYGQFSMIFFIGQLINHLF